MERGQVKKTVKYSLIGIFILAILFYSGFEIRRYMSGPHIVVFKPVENSFSNISLIEISGQASNIIEVKINDNKIFMDEEGKFSHQILLSEGFNVLKISGVDKFDRTTEQLIDIIYKQT